MKSDNALLKRVLKILATLAFILTVSGVQAQGKQAHVVSMTQEGEVQSGGFLNPREVGTVFYPHFFISYNGMVYKVLGIGVQPLSGPSVDEKLEVGKDYEAVGVEKDCLVLMLHGSSKRHGEGMVKVRFSIKGISELPEGETK